MHPRHPFAAALACAAVCVLVAASAGCPQPIEGTCGGDGGHEEEDAGNNNNNHNGTDAGIDAGADAGGSNGTDGGTGTEDGGTDAGQDTGRADAGPFSWALMPGNTTNEIISAVHGNAWNNVYAASDQGMLRHSSGGAFSQVYIGATQYPPTLRGVWVAPNGNVFATGSGVLIHCLNGLCTQQAEFTTTRMQDLTPSGGSGYDVCGRGNDLVYAVGTSLNGRMWQFDFVNSTWKVVAADLGTGGAEDCWVAENGEVFVTGTYGKMVRVTTAGLPVVELVNSVTGSDGSTFNAHAVFGIDGHLYAAGSGRRVIERDPTTKTWNFVYYPASSESGNHFALGGGSPDELFASGDGATDRGLLRFNGKAWSWVLDTDPFHLPYSMDVMDIWSPEPDIIFIAGQKYVDGAVVMGTR